MKKLIFKNLTEQFQFESAMAGVKTVAFGNLFVLLLILVGNSGKIEWISIGSFCGMSGGLILVINHFYNWARPTINLLVLLIYILILILELNILGIPTPLTESSAYNYYGKGMLLEMALYLVPFIYVGIRTVLIIPLVIIYYRALKLQPIQPN